MSLWEGAFTLADVTGTDMLDRASLGLFARSLALRGEWVAYISQDGLVPCSDWDVTTANGKPKAYRLTIPETGGAQTITALAGEVLHVRIGADPAAPYFGSAPLRRASLSAGLLHTLETALAEVYETAPLGSQIVPFPEGPANDLETLGRGFRGRRGRVLLRESVAVTAAGGPAPSTDWRPSDVSPDMQRTMASQSHEHAKAAILNVFGILPALVSSNTTGPLVREAQRHLATWTLQPFAMLLAEEATNKLGQPVMIDVLRPVQGYDVSGRARALTTIVDAMAKAKEAGVDSADFNKALTLVNWGESDGAA